MHFTLGWLSSLLSFFLFVNPGNLTYPLVILLITSLQPPSVPKPFLTVTQIKDPHCNLTRRSGLCLPLIQEVKNSSSYIIHCQGSTYQLPNASESLDRQSDDCTGPPCIFTNYQRHILPPYTYLNHTWHEFWLNCQSTWMPLGETNFLNKG